VSTNKNPPELKLGKGVFHGDLQTLVSNIVHMDRLAPKIKEVLEFQKGLSVNQKL
jgi:hypothetical protein